MYFSCSLELMLFASFTNCSSTSLWNPSFASIIPSDGSFTTPDNLKEWTAFSSGYTPLDHHRVSSDLLWPDFSACFPSAGPKSPPWGGGGGRFHHFLLQLYSLVVGVFKPRKNLNKADYGTIRKLNCCRITYPKSSEILPREIF